MGSRRLGLAATFETVSDFREHPIWKSAKRLGLDAGRREVFSLFHRGAVPLSWAGGRNWGDALSPVLASLLSGRRVIRAEALHHRRYLAIGSILGAANEWAEVWGSGFIREGDRVRGQPRAVHAVRGPLSRDALIAQGVSCPEVFGDPALLLPRLFNPSVEKRYAIGVVPHYTDKSNRWVTGITRQPHVLILDVDAGLDRFVRDVKSCEVILSSSLHGLICADSYRIPSLWIGLSDGVIGGDFKFRDYKASIGEKNPEIARVHQGMPVEEVASRASLSRLDIDLRSLLLACPFLAHSIRRNVDRFGATSGELPASLASEKVNELGLA